MRIERVLATKALAGYYFDDLAAIRSGARQDGFFYVGDPMTPGHTQIRQPGEAVSIVVMLSDGQIAHGDAVSIQYSGVVGRDPVFIAESYLPHVRDVIAPAFEGLDLGSLRGMCDLLEHLSADGRPLHTALRYGMSQALLDAIAKARHVTMAQVVAEEWGIEWNTDPVPVLAQSGDDRYVGVDKMIMKRVEALPQGLFNSVEKVGRDGTLLRDYTKWLSQRIAQFGDQSYRPTIHLDVYGTPGQIFGNDAARTSEYLASLEEVAHPYPIRVEAPVDAGSRDEVLDLMVRLRERLTALGSAVEIVADDWCNTLADVEAFAEAGAADMIQVKAPDLGSVSQSVDAVLACRRYGIKAFLGGTCNGTDQSSRVTVNLAMAAGADLIYNKPGMGVDEGLMIVRNEMARVKLVTEGLSAAAQTVLLTTRPNS